MTSTPDIIEEPYSLVATASESERHKKIQARAYELYLARTEQSGTELHDWLQAELEIDANLAGREA